MYKYTTWSSSATALEGVQLPTAIGAHVSLNFFVVSYWHLWWQHVRPDTDLLWLWKAAGVFLVWGSAAEGVAFFPQSLLDSRKINLSFHNNFVCSVVKMELLLLKVSVPLLFPQDTCCLPEERDQRHHLQHVKPWVLLLHSNVWAIVKLFWAKTRQLHQKKPLLAWRSYFFQDSLLSGERAKFHSLL